MSALTSKEINRNIRRAFRRHGKLNDKAVEEILKPIINRTYSFLKKNGLLCVKKSEDE